MVTVAPDPPPGYKDEHVAVVRRWVPEGARVLELGAGLGVVTAALAARAATVLAVEPIPVMYDAAARRVLTGSFSDSNGYVNVTMLRAAAGLPGCPHTTVLHEMSEPWNSGAHVPHYDRPVREVQVPQVSIDRLIELAAADTLVTDCEGAEVDLLTSVPLPALGVTTMVVEWHPHIVGSGPVGAAKQQLAERGWRAAQVVVGELRPGGFAELAVYRWP